MKARDVIDSAMADWHIVDAHEMAEATFDGLDDAEVLRLARRAYTEEWRAALRVKDGDGVPRYASIEVRAADGSMVRIYKQTSLFTAEDYGVAVGYHRAEARAHNRAADLLTKRCNAVHGTKIAIPGIEAAS